MPKVKLAEEAYKNKALSELIRRYKYGKGLNNVQAGKLVGIGERTFARYMENPGLIPVAMLRVYQKKLGIPKEEMLQLLL